MIFVSGETRCEACGELLDSTDDVFVVSDDLAHGDSQTPKPGFYMFECFEKLPGRNEYLSRAEADAKRQIHSPDAPWVVLRLNDDFALTQNSVDRTLRLTFFKKDREIRYRSQPRWQQFQSFILEYPIRHLEYTSSELDDENQEPLYKLTKTPHRFEMAVNEPVAKEVEFTKSDYISVFGSRTDLLPKPGEKVNFEDLCGKYHVKPTYSDGLLRACKGAISETEHFERRILVRLKATRWTRIWLSFSEFSTLLSFVQET